MPIKRVICSKSDLRKNLLPILSDDFHLHNDYSKVIYNDSVKKHLTGINDNVWFFIESPYIDKVYRDSYYSYFSSKLNNYSKDCIRISLFNGEISFENFTDREAYNDLQDRYWGFIILRPTDPNIVGRSAIAPGAIKNNNMVCITAPINATANFLKFTVHAFPHSSQDTETISCAETTLWSVMEYFGNKYPEYKPVLPSRIVNVLKQISSERQIPTKGLNVQQMAFALREFGFGTKVYSRKDFGPIEFERLFSTYIESGIPLIVAINNGAGIGHALICIGHEEVGNDKIDELEPITETKESKLAEKNVRVFDYDDIERKFVFIDDNHPTYQSCHLTKPATHYKEKEWHSCEITNFIAPLYPKIYLEAFEAKSFFKNLLSYLNIKDQDILIRFYLSSSRSFKHHLALNETFTPDLKQMILEIPMPKFVWVGEISNKELMKSQMADGLVLLDATEANIRTLKILIAAAYKDDYLVYSEEENWFTKNFIHLDNFRIFTHNLKKH